MKLFAIFITTCLLGCTQFPTTNKTAIDPLAQKIALTMANSSLASHAFSANEVDYLKAIRLIDSPIFVHPRFYDKITNVDKREVRRFHLNYAGEISREEVIQMEEARFWEPLLLLAEYRNKMQSFPAAFDIHPLVLRQLLKAKAN